MQNPIIEEGFYHYTVVPIDHWFGLHPLSTIRNKEGGFKNASDHYVEEILELTTELGQHIKGELRHEPYLAFEAVPVELPVVSRVYFKEDENGTTHIFSWEPVAGLEGYLLL